MKLCGKFVDSVVSSAEHLANLSLPVDHCLPQLNSNNILWKNCERLRWKVFPWYDYDSLLFGICDQWENPKSWWHDEIARLD